MLIIIIQGGAKTELPRINSGAGTKWTGAPKVKLFVIGTKFNSTMKLFVVRDRYFPHIHLDHNHPCSHHNTARGLLGDLSFVFTKDMKRLLKGQESLLKTLLTF